MVFIRKNKNRSGSYSIQIVSKERGRYRVLKTVGSGRSEQEIEFLFQRARQEVEKRDGSISLFVRQDDAKIESFSKNNSELWNRKDGKCPKCNEKMLVDVTRTIKLKFDL